MVVVDDSGADDFSTGREYLLEFLLRQSSWKSTDVDIGVFNALAARTGIGDLDTHTYTNRQHYRGMGTTRSLAIADWIWYSAGE